MVPSSSVTVLSQSRRSALVPILEAIIRRSQPSFTSTRFPRKEYFGILIKIRKSDWEGQKEKKRIKAHASPISGTSQRSRNHASIVQPRFHRAFSRHAPIRTGSFKITRFFYEIVFKMPLKRRKLMRNCNEFNITALSKNWNSTKLRDCCTLMLTVANRPERALSKFRLRG